MYLSHRTSIEKLPNCYALPPEDPFAKRDSSPIGLKHIGKDLNRQLHAVVGVGLMRIQRHPGNRQSAQRREDEIDSTAQNSVFLMDDFCRGFSSGVEEVWWGVDATLEDFSLPNRTPQRDGNGLRLETFPPQLNPCKARQSCPLNFYSRGMASTIAPTIHESTHLLFLEWFLGCRAVHYEIKTFHMHNSSLATRGTVRRHPHRYFITKT